MGYLTTDDHMLSGVCDGFDGFFPRRTSLALGCGDSTGSDHPPVQDQVQDINWLRLTSI